jgi:hypothetical protein
MKTLKSAATQFLGDVLDNRCLKRSYSDAIEGLGIHAKTRITHCYHLTDSKNTAWALKELVESLNEYVVTLHFCGHDVRTVYRGDEAEALKLFRSYVLRGKKASLTVE